MPIIFILQKCNPLAQNAAQNATPSSENASVRAVLSGAENRTPSHEITSKMRPLKHKFMVKRAKTSPLHRKQRRKCDPLARKKRVGLSATRQPQTHLGVAWLHFLTQGLHFRPHFGRWFLVGECCSTSYSAIYCDPSVFRWWFAGPGRKSHPFARNSAKNATP